MVDVSHLSSQSPVIACRLAITVPILQLKKPRPKEVGHVADRRQN